MKSKILGSPSFSTIHLELDPNESVITESGAMASMDAGIDLRSKTNGGILKALVMKYLGSESFFINRFVNTKNNPQNLILTKSTPGEILKKELTDNEVLYVQPGGFIACTKTVNFTLKWAGLASFIAKEGLFKIKITGPGILWYGAYGAVIEKEVNGEYIVDTGHLLSYPNTIKLKVQLSGGIFSSFFSGEGFVARLEGSGKVKLQTRSITGLASWLNPKFWR